MAVYSIIQKSQLEGARRLDAEYYQPQYLDLISKIRFQKSKLLSEIGQVVYGTTPKGGIFEQNGIPFFRSQNFSNLLIDTSDSVFCSEKFHYQNRKSAIKPRDILFAAVGATVGKLAIVQDEIKEGNINQNIAAVRITDESINPYFIGFFFASTPGQLQIERLITGNAQPYLNSEQIKSFSVPIFDTELQNEIAKYFHEIQRSVKNSNFLYSQAEKFLLEELGLEDFEADEGLWNVANLSEVKSAGRMDAEYFQPKYEKLFKQLKKNSARPLGELMTMKKGIETGSAAYTEAGRLFIRVSNISKFGLADKDQKYIGEQLYKGLKDNFEPKVGEILLTKDATPGIAYVLKEKMEGIVSGGILRLKLKESIGAEYIAFCLNSIIGRLQAERDAGGSIIAHWKPEQIKQVQVPILPEKTQQKIAELVRESHGARARAKRLLEEAKTKVVEIIEGE